MKSIEVTAAIIHQNRKILICQRPLDKSCGLLWEFPGGKIEEGETGEQCIVRECQEELGIAIRVERKLTDITHEYPDFIVHLHFYLCELVDGNPEKNEHNAIEWITPDEIVKYDFCPADSKMIAECSKILRRAISQSDFNVLTHSDLSFLRELENFTFESKMLTCQQYSSRIMGCSMVDMKLAFAENIMPWELEIFTAYSVIYDNDGATSHLDGDSFERIITQIKNYWHPGFDVAEAESRYAEEFGIILGLQQFSVQGVFLQKLFRYNYFFTFKNERIDMEEEFLREFGAPYEKFALLAFVVFVCCSKEAAKITDEKIRKDLMTKVFGVEAVLKPLCIDKYSYREKMMCQHKATIDDLYYGLKGQYWYPFISDDNYTFIPSPYLVVNAVTESFLNRMTLGNDALRNLFGKEVIENYLFDIYKEVPSVEWISKEIEYGSRGERKRTPDVLVAEGDYCTFYDTKALVPSMKLLKFDSEERMKETKLYAEAIEQIYNQILNYQLGYFNLDKSYDKDHLFGVVVVLEGAMLSMQNVYETVFLNIELKNRELNDAERDYIRSHIKIVPLRQVESFVLQNMSFLTRLIEQCHNSERWNDLNFANTCTDNGCIPSYLSFADQLKKKVIELI